MLLQFPVCHGVTEVGVTVDNGVVTLRGDVLSFAEKETAERVALRVYGVKAVANDIMEDRMTVVP